MVKIYASDFEYNNARLSDYGFIICQFESSGGVDIVNPGSAITFNQIPTHNGRVYPLISTQYDECLSCTFDICKITDDCNVSNSNEISLSEERMIFRWLNRHRFLKFRFVSETDDVVWYMASFNIEEIRINDKLYGLRLTMTTDKPFGYGEQVSVSGNGTASPKTVSFDYSGDEEGYQDFDSITLITTTAGDYYIRCTKVDGSTKDTVIKNCIAGEKIVIDCKNKIITTNKSSHQIYSDFNYIFPFLTRKWVAGENKATSNSIKIGVQGKPSATFSYDIRYTPIIKGFSSDIDDNGAIDPSPDPTPDPTPTTGIECKTYTYSQQRQEVTDYLDNVSYSPDDYSVSYIENYVTIGSKNQPNGIIVSLKSNGKLTIIDGYTGKSVTEEVIKGNRIIYNCTPGVASKFILTDTSGTIVQAGLLKPTGTCRMIYLPNVDNVRDIGGWNCDNGTVKYGKLFRGGALQESVNNVETVFLTDTGKETGLDFLGIEKELDLRFDSDLNGRTVSTFGKAVDLHHVDMSWYALDYQKTSGNIKAIFDPLFDWVIAEKPTYFHCSAGADRTGIVALLCLALLGVSQSDIDKDYELTSFYTGTSALRKRNDVDENYRYGKQINILNSYSGDSFRDKVVNYMLSCGISIEKINAFRVAMIDGTPELLTANAETYTITNNLGSEVSQETKVIEGISNVSISNLSGSVVSAKLKTDNLILLPYDNNFSNSDPNTDETVTSNGETFKPNTDGSITIWGTATATVLYSLRNCNSNLPNSTRMSIFAGTYTIGLYSNKSSIGSSVRIFTNKYTSSAVYLNNPATFVVDETQAATLATVQLQITTAFKDVTEDDPVIIYPMMNAGGELKPFNTPQKRALGEANAPYIPETACEISKDSVITSVSLSDSAKSIASQGVNILSISCPVKYKIELTATTSSSSSGGVSTDNLSSSIAQYSSYITNLTPDDGKIIKSVKVTMGGKDITASVFSGTKTYLKNQVTLNLTNCTSSRTKRYAYAGESYVTKLTADTGYSLNVNTAQIEIKMGGETVDLETCYKNGMISIPIVTGDIVITAIAGNAVVTYTNALLNAVNGNNTKIGNTAWLYQNKRYNSSSELVDETNVSGTGYISVAPGDTIRIRNTGTTSGYQAIKSFGENFVECQTGYTSFSSLMTQTNNFEIINNDLNNGSFDFKIKSGTNFSNNMKYIVIQLYKADLSKLIVTVNQEIEVD